MIILVILFYIIIGLLEIPPLLQNIRKEKQDKKEFIVYISLFSIAFVLSILLSLGIELPSPIKPIESIVTWIIGTPN